VSVADRIAQIRRKLNDLARLQGWELPEALVEAEVAAWEADQSVALPEGYRAFLLGVGNGGPGPEYGLTPLGEGPLPETGFSQVVSTITYDDGDGGGEVSAGTGPRPAVDGPPKLANPFPLKDEWRPFNAEGESVPSPVDEGVNPYDGVLHLVERGCGYFDFLVVTGDRAGQVWTDYTAGDGSIFEASPSFLDWYETWLDDALRGFTVRAITGEDADKRVIAVELAKAWLATFDEAVAQDGRYPIDTRIDAIWAHHAAGNAANVNALVADIEARPDGPRALEAVYRELHSDAFARAEAEPPDVGDDLIEHAIAAVRRTLANNPRCPADALMRLGADDNREVRIMVVRNPAAPAAALEAVADLERSRLDQDLDAAATLEFVARHESCPPALLTQLASIESPEPGHIFATILRAVALNPSTPTSTLEALATNTDPFVRHGVALNEQTPAASIERLCDDSEPVVVAAAAHSPNVSVARLVSLADRTEGEILGAVANHPATPLPTLLLLAGKSGPWTMHRLGRNPARHPEIVELLALLDPDYGLPKPSARPEGWARQPYDVTSIDAVIAEAAGHPAFPAGELMRLIDSRGRMSAYDAGSNPWANAEHLRAIAEDSYDYARAKAAVHRNAPHELLVELASDRSEIVAAAAAAHPNCPKDMLEQFASDEGRDVRAAVAGREDTDPAVRERLAGDPEWFVRAAVARCPATDPELLRRLAKDDSAHVRKAVPANFSAPADLVASLADDPSDNVKNVVNWRRRYDELRR